MIVLDTNVLSALVNPSSDSRVKDWLDHQATRTVWTTAVTVFEIRHGIDRLPEGQRRQVLDIEFDRVLKDDLQGRVLAFDCSAASAAGRLMADRRGQGLNDAYRDTQIAGIVLSRRATLATRDVRHFLGLGLNLVNPWEYTIDGSV